MVPIHKVVRVDQVFFFLVSNTKTLHECLSLNLHRRPALPRVCLIICLISNDSFISHFSPKSNLIKHHSSALSWFVPQSTLPTPRPPSQKFCCAPCAHLSSQQSSQLQFAFQLEKIGFYIIRLAANSNSKHWNTFYELPTHFGWKTLFIYCYHIHEIACFCLLHLVEPIYNCVYVPLGPLLQFPEENVTSSEREHEAESLYIMKMCLTHTHTRTQSDCVK